MEPLLSSVQKVHRRNDNPKKFGARDEQTGIERPDAHDFMNLQRRKQ
jgi:hypothetical protein